MLEAGRGADLWPERGHTSRDCDHQQCFTCGQVDADHSARSCPVSLICNACGSRGHIQRDCDLPASLRLSTHSCQTCGSRVHLSMNCPSLWRIYKESEQANEQVSPKKKRKIVYACANDGSTSDHFIDDWCAMYGLSPCDLLLMWPHHWLAQ